MSLFGDLKDDGLEESGDVLGGGGTLESGAHEAIIKLAFAGKSQSSNARSLVVHFDINGFEYRETYWITNKNGENFYTDKKDNTKRHQLPGYSIVNSLCLLSTGFPLSEQEGEEKTVNLYDFDAKKELPKSVPVLTDLIGKPITIGLLKQIVDKTAKDDSGKYNPTGETREENVADKFFHAESHRTVTEVKGGLEEAVFYEKWVEKNTGKTRNRAKGVEGKSGAPSKGGKASTEPKKSLFGG